MGPQHQCSNDLESGLEECQQVLTSGVHLRISNLPHTHNQRHRTLWQAKSSEVGESNLFHKSAMSLSRVFCRKGPKSKQRMGKVGERKSGDDQLGVYKRETHLLTFRKFVDNAGIALCYGSAGGWVRAVTTAKQKPGKKFLCHLFHNLATKKKKSHNQQLQKLVTVSNLSLKWANTSCK